MIPEVFNFIDQHNGSAMVFLTLAYLIATIVIVNEQRKANRISQVAVETSMKLERQRNRPFVLFDIVFRDSCFYAVLKNFGPQPAIDVHVEIEPPICRKSSGLSVQLSFVANPVSLMAPGREIEDFIGAAWQCLQEVKDQTHTVTLYYKNADGIEYPETETVSFEHYRNLVTISSETPEEKIAKAVAGMERSLQEAVKKSQQR